MATLSRIRVHPIKALDPQEPATARITPVGGLEGDRAYAIVDGEGEFLNGKRTADVHRLRSAVDLEAGTVELSVQGSAATVEVADAEDGDVPDSARDAVRFDLEGDRGPLEAWLSSYFEREVGVVAAGEGGLTDNRVYGEGPPGVTIVSTATLETVASWFPDLGVDDLRDRFRTNLEVDGVEPFWEDGLVAGAGPGGGPRRLRIGDAVFEVAKPVGRCVVPTRDPTTGEATEGFRERFVERREATLPDDADPDVFDHANVLTVLADPTEDARGESIGRGDEVEVLD